MRTLMISKALVVASYRSKLRELARLGVELLAVAPEAWREEGRSLEFEAGAGKGYEVVRTPLAWNGHFHLYYYPALSRIVNEFRPDIVHVDEEAYNLSTFLAFRDTQKADAKALFFSWQNIKRQYPPPFNIMERYVFTRASFAIAGTETAREVLIAKGYRGRLQVIPQFGVDTELFSPIKRDSDRFTVGYIGRLVPEKGISDLLGAFRQLEPTARLIVAGDGPMAQYLDTAAADLKRQGRLERYPRLPSQDVPALMRRLDVLVLPSRTTDSWKEQYGRVLIEAMACGIPVVGSNSGEIPYVIGQAGLVVTERDEAALGNALIRLSTSPELRDRLGEQGRERAVERFSQEAVAAQTYDVYRHIMNAAA